MSPLLFAQGLAWAALSCSNSTTGARGSGAEAAPPDKVASGSVTFAPNASNGDAPAGSLSAPNTGATSNGSTTTEQELAEAAETVPTALNVPEVDPDPPSGSTSEGATVSETASQQGSQGTAGGATGGGPAEQPPTTDAGTIPVVEPATDRGCGDQLLANEGFELGDAHWETSSTFPGIKLIVDWSAGAVDRSAPPHAGQHLLWLGGIPDNEFDRHILAARQRVTIPVGTGRITFSGYVWIATEEDEPGVAYDATYVDFTTLDGDLLWHPHAFTNLESSTDWVYFEYTLDSVSFQPQESILELHSETDQSQVTSFWFDDLSLVADCGR